MKYEGSHAIWANVDIVLTMEQFLNKFSDITCLYLQSSFHVVGEQIEVDPSKITELCLPPTIQMEVDVSSQILLTILPA